MSVHHELVWMGRQPLQVVSVVVDEGLHLVMMPHYGILSCCGASPAPSTRYSGAVATIQVRDVPDEVAEIYRRRAQASGKSLQSYICLLYTSDAADE